MRDGGSERADEVDVLWHELECGSYREDLSLWRELADRYGDPILDIGAGTGRVALELAAAGYRVTALERDGRLLAELARRARQLPITTVQADARDFRLDERYALCIVAMQTIQLLGGSPGRRAFLRSARRHMLEGGAVAVAIVETLEPFEVTAERPQLAADVRERDEVLYLTRPTAIRAGANGFVLERRRETIPKGAERTVTEHREHIDRLSAADLEAEAIASQLRPTIRRDVAATEEHTGSTVVILHV